MTTVVNKRNESFDEYIGRGSIFGNPYEIGRDGTREQVIERYRTWFGFMVRDPIFLSAVQLLRNKKLGCFCKPLLCHGDVIKEFLDKTAPVE